MIAARAFADRDVGVFGLARSGLSAIVSLKAGGARVYVWDEDGDARAEARDNGAVVTPFASWPWERIRTLVLSPGIALTHPEPHEVVIAARNAGAEVIGDVELFAREIRPDRVRPGRAPVIAVTGTNGKSTTTALIGHILASCGFPAQVGGNIGKPALDLAPPNGRTIYVLEIPSDPRAIASAIASFPGLAHRIEEVSRIGRTRFVNDSKATNADAAARALACFTDIYWIAGGRPKQGGIDSLLPFAPRIRKAFLIGE